MAHYRRYQAMLSDPVASPDVKQALAIATFEPCMHEVVKVVGDSAVDARSPVSPLIGRN